MNVCVYLNVSTYLRPAYAFHLQSGVFVFIHFHMCFVCMNVCEGKGMFLFAYFLVVPHSIYANMNLFVYVSMRACPCGCKYDSMYSSLLCIPCTQVFHVLQSLMYSMYSSLLYIRANVYSHKRLPSYTHTYKK